MKIEVDIYADGELQSDLKPSKIRVNRKANSGHECVIEMSDELSSKIIASPNTQRKYFTIRAYIEGYIGKSTPIFEGLIKKTSGPKDKKNTTLLSPSSKLMDAFIDVETIKSFEGEDIAAVMIRALRVARGQYDVLATYNIAAVGTDKKILFDGGKLVEEENRSRGATLRQVLQRCVKLMENNMEETGEDEAYPFGKYVFTDIHGAERTTFLFREIPKIDDPSNVWLELEYGTDLWDLSIVDDKEQELFNDVSVPYETGYVRLTHEGLVKLQGLRSTELNPKVTLPDKERAHRLALRTIYENFGRPIGLEVSDPLLIGAYPHLTLVKITNHPEIREDLIFMVTEVSIEISTSSFQATATLSTVPSTLTGIFGSGEIINS